MLVPSISWAIELDLMLPEGATKLPVLVDLVERYETENEGIDIRLNVVGFNIMLTQLPEQLDAGDGPDLAMITTLGALAEHYVDLTPYVDPEEWEEAYGAVLPWYRADRPEGIFGFHAEMTVTGPYVNLTMFDRADVELPPPGATWDDWAKATMMVMDTVDSYAGMVMDRSGHRFAGPAMSYGAAYYSDDGRIVVDEGFRIFGEKLLSWHASGLMPPDIWPGKSGSSYATGNELFFNQQVPFYMSGSWNIGNVQMNTKGKFDWSVVPVPCGPAGCGAMPGGRGIVALKSGDTAKEKAAARFVAWLGEDTQAREWDTRIFAIPAHSGLQAEGLDYASAGASRATAEGLAAFTAMAAVAAEQTPQAYRLQGDPRNVTIFGKTTTYLSAAIKGEMSLDEALQRITQEVR